MEVITSLQALEAKIAECNNAFTYGSDDAMRRVFQTFRMDFSSQAPPDPFSPEYRAYQFELYRTVTGRSYALSNERTEYITEDHKRRPFPYYTQSSQTTGEHMQAIGFMLRSLRLPPGARVLEFGPGWGNTTLALALLGLQVTAVDMEPNFCGIIRSRATQHDVAIEVVQSDFYFAEQVQEPYDAVLFFECFHHCDDHLRLLRALHRAVKPEGLVYFAAEPILRDYSIPWGLRNDGEALWAIRNFGWMELGFDEGYFQSALAHTGWRATKHNCLDPSWAGVWEARRADMQPESTTAPADIVIEETLPRDQVPLPSEAERQLARELEAVYRSTSWRLTAPLRQLRRLLSPRSDRV